MGDLVEELTEVFAPVHHGLHSVCLRRESRSSAEAVEVPQQHLAEVDDRDVASADDGKGEGGRERQDLSTCSKSIIITKGVRMFTMGQLEAGDWKALRYMADSSWVRSMLTMGRHQD